MKIVTGIEHHYNVRTTPLMVKRLLTLASFLEHEVIPRDDKGSHFDMSMYLQLRDDENDYVYEQDSPEVTKALKKGTINYCATAACACGWAAIIHKRLNLRLPVNSEKTPYEEVDWMALGDKLTLSNYELRFWLFDGGWVSEDNTPKGAARRIRYALKYGVPYDYIELPAWRYRDLEELDTPKPEGL